MIESTAIVHNLGTKFPDSGLTIQPFELGYPEWLNWMYVADARLTFPPTTLLR